MKRIIAILASALIPVCANAADINDLTWVTVNNQVTITDCDTNASGLLQIPETIGGNPVKAIGANAFQNCPSLTSVTIPNSVTSIGAWAFERCSSLTSVTIPNSVTSIGANAFQNCSSLTSMTIPDSVTSIGIYAFRYCVSLTSVTIPNSVTSIGNSAFERCSSLTSVTIPNSVTSIGTNTFERCSSLTSVTIPNSVTSIGANAFLNCTSLTSVTIPNSVTSIGAWAFQNCTSLTSVTIPNSVTSIGNGAFGRCTSLTSVTIPNSVTSIGNSAFERCSSLTSVTIPNSVTSIDNSAFGGCSILGSVIFEGEAPGSVDSSSFRDTPAGAQALVEPAYANSFGGEGATWYGLIVALASPPVEPIRSFHESESEEAVIVDASALANGDPSATYQWYFSDVAITPQAGGAGSSFQIDGVAGNEGTWSVEVTSSGGLSEASFEYRVFTDTDLDGLSDGYEEFVSLTNPNSSDSDGDTLSDSAEVNTYLTDPNLADTDGDGFNDGFEVSSGFDPTSASSTPDTLSSIRTAVEFRFAAALGETYRIEASNDLENWEVIETGISGAGGNITRFYSTEAIPFRAFRARRE